MSAGNDDDRNGSAASAVATGVMFSKEKARRVAFDAAVAALKRDLGDKLPTGALASSESPGTEKRYVWLLWLSDGDAYERTDILAGVYSKQALARKAISREIRARPEFGLKRKETRIVKAEVDEGT